MKKSLIFGAALFACAFGFQSCDKVDNPGQPTVDPVEYEAQTLSFAEFVDKYTIDGVVNLPAGAEFTIEENFELAAPITFVGDEKAPAKIVAKAGFNTINSIAFKNVTIDASEMTTPLVKMNPLPTEGLNAVGAFEVDQIAFENVTVEGLKNQLVYCNKQKYLIKDLSIINSSIYIVGATNKTVIDFNGGGLPLNVTINNSTIEADDVTKWSNGGLFSTQSGSNLAQVTDNADAKHVFTVTNSKLTKISNGKTLCTLRQNNQAWQFYVVKDNVVANCGKKNEFLVGFCAGKINKKENWTASGNVVTFGGENIGEGENTKSGLEGACIVPEAPAAE